MDKITDVQKIAIQCLLVLKKLEIEEITLDALGIIVDSIDLLSHQEAREVIKYCNSFL